MELIQSEKTLTIAAAKAGMDEKTARNYRRLGQLPSQCQQGHTWKTRQDPFADQWREIQEKLQLNPGLEAKTIPAPGDFIPALPGAGPHQALGLLALAASSGKRCPEDRPLSGPAAGLEESGDQGGGEALRVSRPAARRRSPHGQRQRAFGVHSAPPGARTSENHRDSTCTVSGNWSGRPWPSSNR